MRGHTVAIGLASAATVASLPRFRRSGVERIIRNNAPGRACRSRRDGPKLRCSACSDVCRAAPARSAASRLRLTGVAVRRFISARAAAVVSSSSALPGSSALGRQAIGFALERLQPLRCPTASAQLGAVGLREDNRSATINAVTAKAAKRTGEKLCFAFDRPARNPGPLRRSAFHLHRKVSARRVLQYRRRDVHDVRGTFTQGTARDEHPCVCL